MNKNTKLLGGIGSILVILGFIYSFILAILYGPIFFIIFSFTDIVILIKSIGLIILIIAYFRYSKEVNEKAIFKKALAGFLIPTISISALIIVFSLIFIFVPDVLDLLSMVSIKKSKNITSINYLDSYTIYLLIYLLLLWIIVTISAYKWKKADDLLSLKTGNSLFKTSGLLIFIGSIFLVGLVITFVAYIIFWVGLVITSVGLVITFVAYIIKAIAFFNVKES
ncbi:MAG: DUF996 domain-containing protein [Brevinematales bacterium]|nr:DUF996 domain-containing protein [Brevinematales bacterium]